MTPTTAEPGPRHTLTSRSNASRKLLTRKATKNLPSQPSGESVEDSFPPAPSDAAASEFPTADKAIVSVPCELSAPSSLPASAVAPTGPAAAPQVPPAWSDEDERAFKAQSAKRKAAGYRRRGNDVAARVITVGVIKPNPNTTVAVVVGLVAERGSIARAELVAAMASVAFPHPKAQPADPGWCQGYVAGAIRNGFLEVSDSGPSCSREV